MKAGIYDKVKRALKILLLTFIFLIAMGILFTALYVYKQ